MFSIRVDVFIEDWTEKRLRSLGSTLIRGRHEHGRDNRSTIKIGIVSAFPQMFDSVLQYGAIGRAVHKKILRLRFFDPRRFSSHRLRKIDDRLYGGGAGMLMCAQPLSKAIASARRFMDSSNVWVVLLSPQGTTMNQKNVVRLSSRRALILVCGHYKGVDERVVLREIDEEWSIGDYVLSGGEIPAMVLTDAVVRLVPGVLNDVSSTRDDSFASGLLEGPRYTRPQIVYGMPIPSVLKSGDHAKIRRWKMKHALGRTWLRRPDLLSLFSLTEEQVRLLDEFKHEHCKHVDSHE